MKDKAAATMEIPEDPGIPKNLERKRPIVWRMIYYSFAVLLLAAFTAAYVTEFQILTHEDVLFSLGLYGLVMFLHLMMQSLFAYLEIRRINKTDLPCSFKKTVALTIAGYQENPDYLKHCLDSCRYVKYPKDKLKIILVIDGNTEDDAYMMEMFKDVFHGDDVGTYVWKGNYHTGVKETQDGSCPEVSKPLNEDEGIRIVEELVRTKRCVCIMQQWGGKREVMYTAFRAIGTTMDYVQVCDSDTKLDELATVEMVKVLEANELCGAVGGDVRILNPYDSFISFMSSLRYWMAFNVERACQSYFDCVSCISGPLGMYRNDILQVFLEAWHSQKFLGTYCTLGDDRHLTNRVLSMGYRTKYTPKCRAFSETPSQYLRWLNQQTRWTKSYFREWLYNAQWWYKHHIWMTYESVVHFIFPFFITATVIRLLYASTIWNVVWLLLCIQIMSVLKSLYACWLRGNPIMLLMSLYSMLYMTGLLPSKYFAMLTINKSGWGTSGRKKIVGNYMPVLPLSIWMAVLCGGVGYSIYMDCHQDWSTPEKQKELYHLLYGCISYTLYWVLMALMYWVWVKRCCRKRSQTVTLVHDIPERLVCK
ncbi:hyaluronan synthase 1 [Xenopus tropicalis]|uniref:Hyaluronan synthase 1 n=1 Tax=Xenopus tropicalis TaxID=8364 RepID=HYAS1_XENTR|nr:hyaluronan synthase 1 [Xenopus tropicalis]B1WB39.1 RecName: Full=Hyaluronan synthase 1; AltName: Full=Hyaluronate synthase 1; AltName: Full=Hyaluronic acid synthase 1; Short=HA synthase 1 [Xenopus tropicalis]AAI61605.1 LOC100145746 protein [Xenopus tropicalis]